MIKNIAIVEILYSLFLSLVSLDKDKTFYILRNKCNQKLFFKLNTDKKYYSKVYLESKNLKGLVKYYYNYFKMQNLLNELKDKEFYINDSLIETCFLKKAFLIEKAFVNYLEKIILKRKFINIVRLDFRKSILGYSSKIKKNSEVLF